MTTATFAGRIDGLLGALFDALIDPKRSEQTMLLLLAGYLAAWSIYGCIAKSSQDLHFDMGEMFAWSHQVGLSAPTHPPLGAWLVRAWFSVLPVQPWAYYLLAILLATLALWIAWKLSSRYLTPEKRVLGMILLTFIPFYNFHALKFNASSVLTPLWALTTWCFIASFDTRRPAWAMLAGLGAGAAMLGKYWSIFLLAGLGVSAVLDSRRSEYLRSSAPWLTIATGAAVLAPHLVWVATHGFTTFSFAVTSHATTLANAAWASGRFIVGAIGYTLLPVALVLFAAMPSQAAIADTLWPNTPQRRMAVMTFATPLLFAALGGVVARAALDPLWSISAMTLLPSVLLSSPLITLDRAAAVRLLGVAIVFPWLMAAASPAIAAVIHRSGGVTNYATHYRLIAAAIERAWHSRTDQPLRIVGGERDLVDGSNFYFTVPPATFMIEEPRRTPWVDKARIEREGIAIVCAAPEVLCIRDMEPYVRWPGATVEDVTLSRSYFGTPDTAVQYRIVIITPGQPSG